MSDPFISGSARRTSPTASSAPTTTAAVVEAWSSLAPGEESGATVGVAGRVMLLRDQGKAAFADLRDASGALQLFACAAVTERFDEFVKLNLGDWIGARARSCGQGAASSRSWCASGRCWPRRGALRRQVARRE